MSHKRNDELVDAFKEWLEERGTTVENVDKKHKVVFVPTSYMGYYERVPEDFLDLL